MIDIFHFVRYNVIFYVHISMNLILTFYYNSLRFHNFIAATMVITNNQINVRRAGTPLFPRTSVSVCMSHVVTKEKQ